MLNLKDQNPSPGPSEIDKAVDKTVNELAELQKEPKSEEDAQKEQGSAQAEEILKKTSYIEANRLASLKKELEETETRIDDKIKAFKKFVDDTEVQGKSLAGPAVEITEEERKTREAEKLIKGTGLSIRPPKENE